MWARSGHACRATRRNCSTRLRGPSCGTPEEALAEKVTPNGFGAQVVTFDRESCLTYKQELDRRLPPEVSDVVISVNSGEPQYAPYKRDRDTEEKLLDRFRDPKDPLKIIIVTSKLLTGFDAPILQTMYLDKPLRDHTLLQAICRTNRPYGEQKTHGLIVDYLGIFDDVAQALKFDEEGVQQAVPNMDRLARAGLDGLRQFGVEAAGALAAVTTRLASSESARSRRGFLRCEAQATADSSPPSKKIFLTGREGISAGRRLKCRRQEKGRPRYVESNRYPRGGAGWARRHDAADLRGHSRPGVRLRQGLRDGNYLEPRRPDRFAGRPIRSASPDALAVRPGQPRLPRLG